MKVLVSVPVNAFTGYGNDGIGLLRALIAWGADVYVAPSAVHPPLPRDVAAVLTKPIPDHVDLHISHRCPQELAHPESAGLRTQATVALAWTMHEWDSLDNIDELNVNNCEHAFSVRSHLGAALDRFDAVLAYDDVSAAALAPFSSRVAVLQGGVDPRAPVARDWSSSPLRFLMLGALSTRKNPWAAINAFRTLRAEGITDIELILKTTLPGLHPAMERWCPGLRIFEGMMTADEIDQLVAASHVLLAPSWGEGKNIPAAQFAMTGGAVVAPIVGGHAQWLSETVGFGVPYRWTEWSPGVRGASVEAADLAAVMRYIYLHRETAATRARIASRVLPAMMSWEAVLARLMFRLPELVPGERGSEVSVLMRTCRRPEESPAVASSRALSALDGGPL